MLTKWDGATNEKVILPKQIDTPNSKSIENGNRKTSKSFSQNLRIW